MHFRARYPVLTGGRAIDLDRERLRMRYRPTWICQSSACGHQFSEPTES